MHFYPDGILFEIHFALKHAIKLILSSKIKRENHIFFFSRRKTSTAHHTVGEKMKLLSQLQQLHDLSNLTFEDKTSGYGARLPEK